MSVLDRLQSGEQALVPAFWAVEVLNTLLVGERKGRITAEQTGAFLDTLKILNPAPDCYTTCLPDGSDPPPNVEPDHLFARLFDGLAKEQLPPFGGYLWTGAVRKTLKQFASEIDPHAVVSYSNDNGPEFLLDLIWLKPARDDPDANGKIVLAVECEWSCRPDDVWYDFSKLLYVRAPRKLLICCLAPKALKTAIRQFEQDIIDVGGLESCEKYIVINFGNQRVECWWCEPPEPVRFQKGSNRHYWPF